MTGDGPTPSVMSGLVPGIHALQRSYASLAQLRSSKDVDGRDEPGHDGINKKLVDLSQY
jgi:hypothetical protein